MEVKNWYGGRIQVTVQLDESTVRGQKRLFYRLLPLSMGCSNQLAREVGCFGRLRCTVSDAAKRNPALQTFLSQKLVLIGRIFVPIIASDEVIVALQINENYGGRHPRETYGDQHLPSLKSFIDTHNPFSLNSTQVSRAIRYKFFVI